MAVAIEQLVGRGIKSATETNEGRVVSACLCIGGIAVDYGLLKMAIIGGVAERDCVV